MVKLNNDILGDGGHDWSGAIKAANDARDKGEPLVLRTASEIETARRKAKGYPPIKRDGSHGE